MEILNKVLNIFSFFYGLIMVLGVGYFFWNLAQRAGQKVIVDNFNQQKSFSYRSWALRLAACIAIFLR